MPPTPKFVSRYRSRLVETYADEMSSRWTGRKPRPLVAVLDPGAAPAASRERSIAVVCHVFYIDVLSEIATLVGYLPARADLYFSVVRDEDARVVERHFAAWEAGSVTVRVVPNRGRDVAPKYVTFADVYSGGYELMLFLHTKKSTNEVVGPLWRHYLFESLAGSRQRAVGVLNLFDEDPGLGVVAPQHYPPIRPWIGWSRSFRHTRVLARRSGLKVRSWSPPDFPSGSMFWARPEALRALTDLHLRLEDFPLESGQIDDTIMHGLERLVYLSAAAGGYSSATVTSGTGSTSVPADESEEEFEQRTPVAGVPSRGVRLRVALVTVTIVLPGFRRVRSLLERALKGGRH